MHAIVGKLYKGDVAEITEAGDTWTHVESGNVDGYVKNSYCVTGSEAYTYANDTFDTEVENPDERTPHQKQRRPGCVRAGSGIDGNDFSAGCRCRDRRRMGCRSITREPPVM